jgi:hypothetical protein
MKIRAKIGFILEKNKSIGGNKHICGLLLKINNRIVPNKYVLVDFFTFSNKRPVHLFRTLEYSFWITLIVISFDIF